MSSSLRHRVVAVTDEPQRIDTPSSNSILFKVTGASDVATVDDADGAFADGVPFATGEWSPSWQLLDRDELWVVCDTGQSSEVAVHEGGV